MTSNDRDRPRMLMVVNGGPCESRVFLKLGGGFLRKKHQMKKNRAHEFEALFIILFDLVFF